MSILYASLDNLRETVDGARQKQGTIIGLTNGCFDVLHPGHIRMFARALRDVTMLVVLINSDRSVRELKGEGRPRHTQADRAFMVNHVLGVDCTYIFDEARITKYLEILRPHVWYKGGDYTIDSLNAEEVSMAREVEARIELIPIEVKTSTTEVFAHGTA